MNSSYELPPWKQITHHLKGQSPGWPQLGYTAPGRTTAPGGGYNNAQTCRAAYLRSQMLVVRLPAGSG